MSITFSSSAALNSLNFLITTTARFYGIDTITHTKTKDETKSYFKLRSIPWSGFPHSYTNKVAAVQTEILQQKEPGEWAGTGVKGNSALVQLQTDILREHQTAAHTNKC